MDGPPPFRWAIHIYLFPTKVIYPESQTCLDSLRDILVPYLDKVFSHCLTIDRQNPNRFLGLDFESLFLGPLWLERMEQVLKRLNKTLLALGRFIAILGSIGQLGQNQSSVLSFLLSYNPSRKIFLDLSFGVIEDNDVLPLRFRITSTICFVFFCRLLQILEDFLDLWRVNLSFKEGHFDLFNVYLHVFCMCLTN